MISTVKSRRAAASGSLIRPQGLSPNACFGDSGHLQIADTISWALAPFEMLAVVRATMIAMWRDLLGHGLGFVDKGYPELD